MDAAGLLEQTRRIINCGLIFAVCKEAGQKKPIIKKGSCPGIGADMNLETNNKVIQCEMTPVIISTQAANT
jgi:hypothetical protein